MAGRDIVPEVLCILGLDEISLTEFEEFSWSWKEWNIHIQHRSPAADREHVRRVAVGHTVTVAVDHAVAVGHAVGKYSLREDLSRVNSAG